LAQLVPQLNLLLPGHNVPVAEPAYLTKLAAAARQVQSGKRRPQPNNDGLREYKFEGFSILVK
jgi:hypothetical protein